MAALAELPPKASGEEWGPCLRDVASHLEAIDRSLRPLSAVALLVENEALSSRTRLSRRGSSEPATE